MRSGEKPGGEEPGGAWHCVLMMSEERSGTVECDAAGSADITENATSILCTDADCTNGRCVEGIMRQQSIGLPPCEQCIEAQQCIAAACVWMPEQSTA